MTSTITALHNDAAKALASQLPSGAPLTIQATGDVPAGILGDAVTASYVGGVSADFALVIAELPGAAEAGLQATDLLRPALEAAGSALGAGVLGDVRRDGGSALAGDPESVAFELVDAGRPAGWFVVRIRENGTVGASAPAAFGSAFAGSSVADKLGRINNVEMALTVEIGRTRMSVRDVLGLEPGAVIELDRSAGAPADVLLNGRLIAHGEVVVVDQDYAVRITKILDIADGQN
ncbi:flagellar motor switch protein FliN [Frondihabitans australicus]|uniref:Flagellar motor switch protein FliN/FliY n=1 Tax=Frondihabitans australicus TaxID=386892 RepID=A0A495IHU6_9MICO|nr:flagellar motor switch protein FliN [Frondihabitans australicus]RKR75553.1 flagellar motor switch protein FliN/FliY [Frondihabitans australicus]